jgi:hypothetical protein
MGVGIASRVTVDGIDYDFAPDTVTVDFDSNERMVATLGDTFLYRDSVLAGLPDVEERFSAITFPIGGLETDTDRRRVQLLRVQGGFHTLALWVPERMVYTATETQTAFYIGRRRRDAGVAHDRAAMFPMTATRNGSALSVTVVAGETPSVPAAGVLNLATTPKTTGIYKDYTAFAVAASSAGDVIEVTYYPLLRVFIERPRVGYSTVTESHDLTMVER